MKCPDCDYETNFADTMKVHAKITGHARALTDAEREELMMKEWEESRLARTQEEMEEETRQALITKRNQIKAKAKQGLQVLPDGASTDDVLHPEVGQLVYLPDRNVVKMWTGSHWVAIPGNEHKHVQTPKFIYNTYTSNTWPPKKFTDYTND